MTIRCTILLLVVVSLPRSLSQAEEKLSLREYVKQNESRQAYGVYFGKKKVGWFVDESTLVKRDDGKEVAVATSNGRMALTILGSKLDILMEEKSVYSVEGKGMILFSESKTTEGDEVRHNVLEREDNKWKLTTSVDGLKQSRDIPAIRHTLSDVQEMETWLKANPKANDQYEIWSVSLDEEELNVKNLVTFLKREKSVWGGVPTTIFHLKSSSQGLHMEQQVTAEGILIKGKMGPFDLRAEEEELAKKLDHPVLDMLSIIKVEKNIGDPRKVETLSLELSGLGEHKLPDSHRQKFRRDEQGRFILDLKRDFPLDIEQKLSEDEQKKFTATSPTLQCDSEKIQQLAKKIVGEETDPMKVADKLQQWVYRKLRKTYGANASSALRILDNKAGDCTEHTLLFVSLARAAGLPAREVTGLGYTNIGQPSFGWHAWAEIHNGKQWVSVDPTWNEVYVDATHIKVSEGTDDYSSVNLIGSLKVKILTSTSEK